MNATERLSGETTGELLKPSLPLSNAGDRASSTPKETMPEPAVPPASATAPGSDNTATTARSGNPNSPRRSLAPPGGPSPASAGSPRPPGPSTCIGSSLEHRPYARLMTNPCRKCKKGYARGDDLSADHVRRTLRSYFVSTDTSTYA